MTDIVPTHAEAAIADTIAGAMSAREPLLIQGNGTKSGMLRAVQAARVLSIAGLSGITLYSPSALIISALAGDQIGVRPRLAAEPEQGVSSGRRRGVSESGVRI